MANKTKYLRQQLGFSLVELMVGLVIGLIASLVIMQTFSEFEGNKRSTTGTSDAQTNGNIGLYMVQRELQFAGYGIPMLNGTMPQVMTRPFDVTYQDNSALTVTQIQADYDAKKAAYATKVAADTATVNAGDVFSALKCRFSPDSNVDADSNAATPSILESNVVNPVTVTDGAAGASDTIAIRYGDTTRGAIATEISRDTPAVSPTVFVGNNLGCRPDDTVLITEEVDASGTGVCNITKITSTLAELDSAQHDRVKLASLAAINVAKIQRLSCLGKVRQITFDVNDNQLRKTNPTTGAQEAVLSEIVSLQAQYGISASPNSEIIVPNNLGSWVNAAGVWANPPNTGNVCSATVANRNCIKAVRIAIVARNNLLEKTAVSQACSGTAAGAAKVCVFGGDLTFANTDWPNYRYRVYEVVVPLRNVLAATPQL